MSVRVVARIRPLIDQEDASHVIVHSDGPEPGKPGTTVKIPNPKNELEEFSFAFSSVYDQDATQEDLFTAEVAPHLKALFHGSDLTIFAYGVTGTGKTHTMRGGLKLADRGVIPRLLSGVFRRAKKIAKDTAGDTTVQVALSYYEIYNDKVYDLLEPPEKRTPAGLPLRERGAKTFVVGLSERRCRHLNDFEKLYIEANNNRATAATKLNAHSSRSHAILRVKLTQTTAADGSVRESTASAIDLAGSEDNRRTDNAKERLVESAAINKSLFVLSQCIDAIARGDKRVPYRESKMTRILSLGQSNAITIMILNLAPLRSYHLDTLSSLNVSSRAKRIEVREIENEVVYKQVVPRGASSSSSSSNATVSGAPRQPLRPLVANTSAPSAATTTTAKPPPPIKAFSVYTDRARLAVARTTSATTATTTAKTTTTTSRPPLANKRPSDPEQPAAKAAAARPRTLGPTSISSAQIEAMVERKVSEILAARAAEGQDQAAAQAPGAALQPDANEAVQRRLDALERRIENEDRRNDGRSDGLKLLLAARQAKEHGDEPAALALYEAAVPFFPRETKLLSKIERLRAKLASQAASAKPGTTDSTEHVSAAAPASSENSAPASPRTRQLLDIVNSRDAARIRELSGFGAKRAADLVEQLRLMADKVSAERRGLHRLETLDQLKMVPGIGGRMVQRAYEGLVVPVGGALA